MCSHSLLYNPDDLSLIHFDALSFGTSLLQLCFYCDLYAYRYKVGLL